MTVLTENVQLIKAALVTDTSLNGGLMGYASFTAFRPVGNESRVDGITRYEKVGIWDKDTNEIPLSLTKAYIAMPSISDDRFHIGMATHDDTQGDWISDPPVFTGSGVANSDITAGDTEVDVLMEGNDAEFAPGGTIIIANKIMTSQTMAVGVDIGDFVLWDTDKWKRVSPIGPFDPTYPNGIYMGSNKVFSSQNGVSVSSRVVLAEQEYTEDIGTGDGATAAPPLSTLTNATAGIVAFKGFLPVITATVGGVPKTVTVDSDGSCSGYCTAGELNTADGTWTADIAWTAAPDNATDISITYNEKNYVYVGNVATLQTAQVPSSYTAAETVVCGCVAQAEVGTSVEDFAITSTAGTYDISTYPVTLSNLGTREDDITLTFTNPTTFTVSGANAGSLGTGSFGGDFTAVNPTTGATLLEIRVAGFGGVWVAGDTITLSIHPAIFNIVMKQTVEADTAASKSSILLGIEWE